MNDLFVILYVAVGLFVGYRTARYVFDDCFSGRDDRGDYITAALLGVMFGLAAALLWPLAILVMVFAFSERKRRGS